VVSELSDLVYFLFTTFAHTMTMLPIINKLKKFSVISGLRYTSGPERSGGAFKPTKEVPVCHTGPYRLTSSPAGVETGSLGASHLNHRATAAPLL